MPSDADQAFQTDVYLEALLAQHGGGSPISRPRIGHPEPGLRAAAELLERSLVRFHPSFRFEEALAARLHARSPRPGQGAESLHGTIVPFRSPPVEVAAGTHGRSLLLRGAIASGFSLAGAALFAWRRTRTPTPPFARAARAARVVHRVRRADTRHRPRLRREPSS
ncbi:hypothetical protein BH20CHL6_BH20CHL6_09590 [soil metagenome]